MRTWLRDLFATLRLLFRRQRQPVLVFSVYQRWAICFDLDGLHQIWYTDSEAQARQFARNLRFMGVENSECAG